jgi:hypothetical protein
MAGKLRPIRRIVTGHDAEGRSIIVTDAASPHVQTVGADDFGVTDLWKTRGTPADNTGSEDPCGRPITLAPPPQGSVFRVVQFPPDKDYLDKWKPEDAFATMGESGAKAIDRSAGAKHAGMHKTASVDYAFVLEGEIWAIMDKGEVLMRAGDMLIQRGTNHAWSNRSSAPALVGFVLIDAKPLQET